MLNPTSISYHGGSLSTRYTVEAYQRDIPCRLPSIPVALNPNRSLLLIPGVVINFDAGLVISVGASILEYVLARA